MDPHLDLEQIASFKTLALDLFFALSVFLSSSVYVLPLAIGMVFLFLVISESFPPPFLIQLCKSLQSLSDLDAIWVMQPAHLCHPFFPLGWVALDFTRDWNCLCDAEPLLLHVSVLPSVWMSLTFLSDGLLWEILVGRPSKTNCSVILLSSPILLWSPDTIISIIW